MRLGVCACGTGARLAGVLPARLQILETCCVSLAIHCKVLVFNSLSDTSLDDLPFFGAI